MPRSARLALVLALCLAPWEGRALAAPASTRWNAILIDNNPDAAADFLKDPAAQAQLKSEDEGYYMEVFARAAELKDLSDLLNGIDARSIYRDGLEVRAGCQFCRNPDEILAWSHRYFGSLGKEKFTSLERALFEWHTLEPERLRWLQENGETEKSWAKRDLVGRQAFLRPWAEARYEAFMKEVPRDSVAARAYVRDAWAISDLLDPGRRGSLWERVEKAQTAVSGLAQARALADKSGNPALKAELARAASSGDLDALLSGLNKVFDGAGRPNAQLRAQSPPRKRQIFDAASREVVAELLKSGLEREILGTWAGDELKAFYEKRPLDLRVATSKNSGYIGWYDAGRIIFNEAFIAEYLKVRGRDIRDLRSDPALLRELTAQIAPLFVHEATHHRQFAWAEEKGLDVDLGQHLELEAMQTEALFILEKSSRDPSYLALLKKNAPHSVLARESLDKATSFRRNPAHFRDTVKAYHYSRFLSLEGVAWTGASRAHMFTRAYAGELVRRQRLPAGEAAELEDGPELDMDAPTWEAWRQALAHAGTKHLRALLAAENKKLEKIPPSYTAYRDRLDQASQLLEDRRLSLLDEKDPAKTRRNAKEVPSPGAPVKP